MRDEILTLVFIFTLNAIMEYLETMPNYNCPVYCEAEHEHYYDVDWEEIDKTFRSDSTFTGGMGG